MVTKEMTVRYKQWSMDWYSPASVNVGLAVLNGFLTLWAGRSAGCVQFGCSADIMRNRAENCPGSNITGFCMLPAGKGDLRLFHLLETICSTGIRVSELRFITVNAVQRGWAEICNKGKHRTILLSRRLCEKLLRYCRERGITHGSIFVTRSEKPVSRGNIWAMMKALCRRA